MQLIQPGEENNTASMGTKLTGVIFRRTIRASYASLDMINDDEHYVALIQFHELKDVTNSRSFIRRECKLGSEVELDGMWEDERFQVQLKQKQGDFIGLIILQKQKLDMIECQQAREKYYPTFDKLNKQKVKSDVHKEQANSMSKKKQKRTEGTGHGGGIGKRKQGEIVRDFMINLVLKQLKEDDLTCESSVVDEVNTKLSDMKDRHVQLENHDINNIELNEVVQFLNRGSGVMDVAGGSGHVSLALSLIGIKSTVIDPRETVGKLPSRDRKALKKAIKAYREKTVDISPSENQMDIVQLLPPPVEFAVKGNQEKAAGNSSSENKIDSMKLVPPPLEFDSLRAWFAKRPDGIDTEFREGQSRSDTGSIPAPIPICSMCSQDNLLPECSAIVALHPDEATGDIVDFAVKHRLPFVIVPCCVFSRLFPMRFKPLKNGDDANKRELVSTYDDLIEYLVNKHDSIRISKLNFDGANLALWSTFPNEERIKLN